MMLNVTILIMVKVWHFQPTYMLPSQRRAAGHVMSTYRKPLISCQNSGGSPAWLSFLDTYFLIQLAEYM